MESTGNGLDTTCEKPARYFVAFDTENSGAQRNHAHPFDPRNDNIAIGIGLYRFDTGECVDYSEFHEYSGLCQYSEIERCIHDYIEKAEVVVGFNLKYDLHWLRRKSMAAFNEVISTPLFDCQVAEFILSYQQTQYPSLNATTVRLGGMGKIDIVATEYWDKGFDTDQVPKDILLEYLRRDVDETAFVFVRQLVEIKEKNLGAITKTVMQDIKMLQEMEWNGQLYNVEKSVKAEHALSLEMSEVRNELCVLTGATHPQFNWSSPVQLRALLYGGEIVYDLRVPDGVYKTGKKAGQEKFRIQHETVVYPQLFVPPKTQKGKLPGTGKDEIKKLKATNAKSRRIKELLVLYSEYDQQISLYYKGLPEMCSVYGWDNNHIHGQLNQCVAVTGRLSSTKPNQQNLNKKTKILFESRFPIRRNTHVKI